MKIKLLLPLLFLLFDAYGQESDDRVLYGRVVAGGVAIAEVDVVNLVNEKAVRSNHNGEFRILAKPDDLLVISGKDFEYMRLSVSESDYAEQPLVINLIPKAIELEETVVNAHAHINAVDLGILQSAPKVYTPAERKLYAAESGPLDAVLNMMSGRTEMRRKEVQVEKKEMLLERLKVLFEDESYFSKHLSIPADRIEAFLYFAVEDATLASAVSQKNKDLVSFNLGRLAAEFLKRGANED